MRLSVSVRILLAVVLASLSDNAFAQGNSLRQTFETPPAAKHNKGASAKTKSVRENPPAEASSHLPVPPRPESADPDDSGGPVDSNNSGGAQHRR
jgi:hypothetical protein